jgi:hypothetical protein
VEALEEGAEEVALRPHDGAAAGEGEEVREEGQGRGAGGVCCGGGWMGVGGDTFSREDAADWAACDAEVDPFGVRGDEADEGYAGSALVEVDVPMS